MLWLALTTISWAQEPAAKDSDGKLIVYDHETETGIVAHRKFNDERGRLARVVSYVPAGTARRPSASAPASVREGSFGGPFDPNNLEVLRSETYDYDDDGRLVRTSTYSPASTLTRFRVHRYDRQGFLRTTVDFTSDGRRSSEIRFAPPETTVVEPASRTRPRRGRVQFDLVFDDTGERLIAVRGALPDDLPWTWGWGPERKGLCCAIAPSNACVTLAEVRVAVSVRNVTEGMRNVALGQGCYRPVLYRTDGQIVPIGLQGDQYLRRPLIAWRSIEPGQVSHSDCFPLGWWYPDLPPGDYSLQVEYRGDRDEPTEWLLASNILTITILSPAK